jgi:hypothetical protein
MRQTVEACEGRANEKSERCERPGVGRAFAEAGLEQYGTNRQVRERPGEYGDDELRTRVCACRYDRIASVSPDAKLDRRLGPTHEDGGSEGQVIEASTGRPGPK